MKRIRIELLTPGDIVLTASPTITGKVVRLATKGEVSHAMICVEHGSVIDSTADGVQARNLQRTFFADDEKVVVLRLRDEPYPAAMAQVIVFARSEIGTRYSYMDVARLALGKAKPRGRRQFCSRLVARAYGSIGVMLAANPDNCTPDDLHRSPLLREMAVCTESVTDEERKALAAFADPNEAMRKAHNAIMDALRRLDPGAESFTDLDWLVVEHPEWDQRIAKAIRASGYLDLWRQEVERHSYRYDQALMEDVTTEATFEDLRQYCIATIREAHSGGLRFAVNLVHFEARSKLFKRETFELLVSLYRVLVRSDQTRREVARTWLLRRNPVDVTENIERITPHGDLWFSMVDPVEPRLAAMARASIEREGSKDVCSTCGDSGADFKLTNSAETMPGVPSMRLCPDCVAIRRGLGEMLEALD